MEDEPSFLWEPNPPRRQVDTNYTDDDGIHEDVDDLFKELHGISVEELEVELRRKEKELYLCSRLGLFLAQEVDELVSQRRGIVSDHTRLLLELQEYRDSRRSYLDISDGASEHAGASAANRNTWSRTSMTSSEHDRRLSVDHGSNSNKISSLQSQVFKFDESALPCRGSTHYSTNRSENKHTQTVQSEAALKSRSKEVKNRKASTKSNTSLKRLSDSGPVTLERTFSIESLDLLSNAESTMTSSSVRDLHNDLDSVQRTHDRITRLEVQLDKTRAKYRSLMTNYAHKLKEMSRQLGSCVTKARPYFEAVRKSKKSQHETQQAAMEYKRAVNLQKAARDMVKVAEERVMNAEDKLDPTWQEMLNQANIKVNEALQEKSRIHKIHLKSTKLFQDADDKKMDLQQKLQRSIVKSKPYFEIQREFQEKLERTTKRLNLLELKLMEARQTYSISLTHLRRSGIDGKSSKAMQSLAERGSGVGAENPLGIPGTAGLLPKPALDFLERETAVSPDGASKTNCDEIADDLPVQSRTKLHYNPYDLLYLTDIGSDSPSNIDSDSDDDYIQDF